MLANSRVFSLAVILLIAAIGVIDVTAQSSCRTLRQQQGVCVPILSCPSITQLLEMAPRPLPQSIIELVQRSHCGTIDDVHHVCCEANQAVGGGAQPTTSRPRTTTTPSKMHDLPPSKSVASVDKSAGDVQRGMGILQASKCGKSDADRVANGEDAFLSEFPWMALLVYDDGLDRSLDCGGSLITDRYVLTAAHCIRVGNKRLVSVRLGEHDTKTTTDCILSNNVRKCAPAFQEIDIEEAVYHKDYNPSLFSDDIGVVRLNRRAEFNSAVKPICLPITSSSQSASLEQMIIAGWGRIENGLKASVLQKALVPVTTNEYCQNIHRVIRISEKQMCAGGQNQIDTCKGDSGGPIFTSVRYRLGARYVQYGVVSAGSALCGSNFPGIYVRVMSYLPWIAGNLSP